MFSDEFKEIKCFNVFFMFMPIETFCDEDTNTVWAETDTENPDTDKDGLPDRFEVYDADANEDIGMDELSIRMNSFMIQISVILITIMTVLS